MKQRLREYASLLEDLRAIGKPAVVVWGFFLAIWLFMSISRLGFEYDAVGLSWGPPGAPITFLQVIAVFAVSVLLTAGMQWSHSRIQGLSSFVVMDAVIFVAVWALAVVLWSNEPMKPTHFSPPPMPPNNETYPNSDALLFDRASYQLLYGTGFADHLTRRPLYVGMLAFFHMLVGGDYNKTVFLQILVLALIPAVVFLLTSKLSNRPAGLIAAGIILLREQNSIALSGEIVTSHAKLMMSDMITALGVVVIVYLAIHWLFKDRPGILEFAILGACIGLTALIRAQVVVLAAPLLLFIFLFRRPLRQAFIHSSLLVVGIIIVMLPWVWRNWNLTGTFVLDDRGEERLLARNYSLPPLSTPEPLPGESEEDFSARIKSGIISFVVTHPDEVVRFVSNHFLRNLATGSVYIAPSYSDATPAELVEHLPFWNEWTGDLTRNSAAALFLNLGILAFGIGIAASKKKWVGLLPLVIFLTYSLGNALVRSSGWRFNQPADWIVIIYYSMALAYLPSQIPLLFGKPASSEPAEKDLGWHTAITILSILFLLGASVPIAERIIPARTFEGVTARSKTTLLQQGGLTEAEISDFLKQKDAVLLSGIALYPRYVRPNSRFDPLETSESYSYLHLHLINDDDAQVVLPLQNAPSGIPHTSILSVLGCRDGNLISAFAVIVQEPAEQVFRRETGVPLRCPLP